MCLQRIKNKIKDKSCLYNLLNNFKNNFCLIFHLNKYLLLKNDVETVN